MTSVSSTAHPYSAFIYGSCVSRDLARIDAQRFKVGYYLARQSWISAFSQPLSAPSVELKSAFQRRMIDFDFRSMGGRLLDGSIPSQQDFVLLDLVDERLGVVPLRGGWVTWSGEMRRAELLSPSEARQIVHFGEDDHFELWSRAAVRMRERLAPILERVFVLRTQFAALTREGATVEPSAGRSASDWNSLYERYFEHLDTLGFTLIEQTADLSISTAAHKWGVAPFHYVDEAYTRFGDEILTKLHR